jgi:predicted nucleic acid-binding protein
MVADNWIAFVDTNVFLDFYRSPGESVTRQTALLEKNVNKIIMTDQVRMEFLKNRQKVIIESIKKIEKYKKPSLPSIIQEYRSALTFTRKVEELEWYHNKIKEKIERDLHNPSGNDPVYVAVKRIFDHNGSLNLQRPDRARYSVRNLARKRFALGYPPRKNGDNSIGDAINWEWIIQCALNTPASTGIMIVTRDQDFGITYNKETYLNDWLTREFKDRVSRQREIRITARLNDYFKLINENITKEDTDAEDMIIEESLFSLSNSKSDVDADLIKVAAGALSV